MKHHQELLQRYTRTLQASEPFQMPMLPETIEWGVFLAVLGCAYVVFRQL
jgi:hypothetical protein